LRRLRSNETLRRMTRETSLSRDDLILPLFIVEGSGVREPVASMPGVHRFSVDTVVVEAKRVFPP
jgi:porphobilinogen synthase